MTFATIPLTWRMTPGQTGSTAAPIHAVATQNLSRFNLDFQGLKVRQVTVDGRIAHWERRLDHELIITPRRGLPAGREFTVWVRYDGVPRTLFFDSDLAAGFIHTDDGAVIAGQPEVAANWFPVNDHPLDKASYTFIVTVPKGLEVVATGRLMDRWTRGPSTTWVWQANEPLAPYLATATIGQFRVRSYRTRAGTRMWDAVDPDLYGEPSDPKDPDSASLGHYVDHGLALQERMMKFLGRRFGSYPFSTGGGLADDDDELFFALETQTRSIYSKYFFIDAFNAEAVVVHEVAHQWFGDHVALARWQDIWLNEGPATYAEWLWSNRRGFGSEDEIFAFWYDVFPADDPFWQLQIGDPGPAALFDFAVYIRGGMTLHALRREIGNQRFFNLLRRWQSKRAGGHGTTPQFIRLAERIAGRQLDDFFQTWLFEPGRPALTGDLRDKPRPLTPATGAPVITTGELLRYRR